MKLIQHRRRVVIVLIGVVACCVIVLMSTVVDWSIPRGDGNITVIIEIAIVDGEGTPVEGALVELLEAPFIGSRDGSETLGETTTGADGRGEIVHVMRFSSKGRAMSNGKRRIQLDVVKYWLRCSTASGITDTLSLHSGPLSVELDPNERPCIKRSFVITSALRRNVGPGQCRSDGTAKTEE